MISGMPINKAKAKAGFTRYQAQANQQKAMAASGQPSTRMQGAMQHGGGGYGQVQNVIQNAWKNYQPTASQYRKEVAAGEAPARAFRERNRKKSGGSQPQSGGSQGGGGYTGQSTIKPPKYIADATTEDAAGNVMAAGYQQADPRYQTKKITKAGISNGAGQQFIAGQEGVQAMSQAAGQAADIRSQDQMANDKMRSDYEQMRETEALQKSILQHQMAQSDWSRRFAEESANAQLQMSYMQALQNLRMSLLR